MSKSKAIGVISHRTNPECYPSFEVSTCREEYNFGSCYLVGVRADRDTYSVMAASWKFDKYASLSKEGANKRGNSSRLTQSFHFFMFEPIFSPVNALN
ncbi:hypothetical protein ACWJOI_19550, partial [Escherichia coli]